MRQRRAGDNLAEKDRAAELRPGGGRAESVDARAFVVILGWAWLMLTLAGAVLLLGGGVLPGGTFLSVPRAVFQAVSASMLAGFPAVSGVDTFQPFGQSVVILLTGVGALVSMVVSGLAVRRVAGLVVSDAVVVLVSLLLVAMFVAVGPGIGVSVSSLRLGLLAGLAAGGNSASTLAAPSPGTVVVLMAVLPVSFVGSMGAVVLIDVWMRLVGRKQRLTMWSWWTIRLAAGAFVLASAVFFVAGPEQPLGEGVARAVGLGGVVVTSGLPAEYATQWPRPVQVIAMLLAAVGLSLGGTGAGVGWTTMVVLGRGLWLGLTPGGATWLGVSGGWERAGGESAAPREFWISFAYGLAFLGLVGLTFLCLLATEPQMQADRLLMLASSAAANSGLTHDPVSVVGRGLFVLSGAMLLGRVLSLAYLWQLAACCEASGRGLFESAPSESAPLESAPLESAPGATDTASRVSSRR